MIEFDVETDGFQWYAGDRAFLSQFYGNSTDEPDLRYLPAEAPAAQNWLGQDLPYRAWNTKFDLHFLRAGGFELPPEAQWRDGMVDAHLIDERSSVALQARGDRLFGDKAGRETEVAVKGWLAEEAKRRRAAAKAAGTEFEPPNYSHVPRGIMDPYAAHDVVLQRQIGDTYDPIIAADPELAALSALEVDVLGALFWMEDRGVPVDRDAIIRLEASLMGQLDGAEALTQRIAAFDNFNPRSPAQVGEALERLGADTTYMTRSSDTKQLVVDEENLEACDHPLAAAVLAYRGTHKLWAMVHRMIHGKPGDKLFPKPYLTGEDLLHPNFRQVGARTGRMSCSNPNFQQINRDDLRLRYAIAARPGKVLVCCDLDQIELRLLAAFAGDGSMLDLVRSGRDAHAFTAQQTGLTGRRRSTGVYESPRQQGKRANYLVTYGGGVRAFRKWFGIPQDEARALIARWHATYPEVGALQNRIEFALEDRGYVKSPWGRRFRVQGRADREAYKFLNYLIQGTAADIFKVGTARCHAEGLPLIAAVHDELIAEVDSADAEEAARIMERSLTHMPEVSHKVPITAEAKIVKRWSQAKDPDYIPDYMED